MGIGTPAINRDSRFPSEERKLLPVAVVADIRAAPHAEWTSEARRGAEARK
jgi:hypothetical protein